MIYHIVTGDLAAVPLKEAIASASEMAGELLVVKDVLSVGPIQKELGTKFSDLRSSFWHEVVLHEKNPIVVDDLERLLLAANELSKNQDLKIWIWVAPIPADVCTYLWALKFLAKYVGRVYVVNIAGLPFLDEQGKVVYPKSLAGLLPRELVKARKLARLITPSEIELDTEEWDKAVLQNGGVRTLEGSKRIVSHSEGYYDAQLLGCCTTLFQKASKIVGLALTKNNIPTGDLFLGWRLRMLATGGKLLLQGDPSKSLRDFEVRLPE